MEKIKLDKRVVVFAGLSAILLVELFVLIPASIGRIKRYNREINDFEEKINLAQSQWPRKESYLEQKESLRESLKSDKKRAIVAGGESRLISYISENSLNYDIRIQSITPRDSFSSQIGAFNYLPFRIEAEGRFYGLKGFLNFLYEGDYFFELKELSLAGHNPSRINMILWGLRKNE